MRQIVTDNLCLIHRIRKNPWVLLLQSHASHSFGYHYSAQSIHILRSASTTWLSYTICKGDTKRLSHSASALSASERRLSALIIHTLRKALTTWHYSTIRRGDPLRRMRLGLAWEEQIIKPVLSALL